MHELQATFLEPKTSTKTLTNAVILHLGTLWVEVIAAFEEG